MKKTIFILVFFVLFSPFLLAKEIILKCDSWGNAQDSQDLQIDLNNKVIYEIFPHGKYESKILSVDENTIFAHSCENFTEDSGDGVVYELCLDYEISPNSNFVNYIIYQEKHINDKNNNKLIEGKINCKFNKNDLLVDIQDFIQKEKENEEALLLEAQKKKIKTIGELDNLVKIAKRSSEKNLFIAIYNNQNQKRYIGVKID